MTRADALARLARLEDSVPVLLADLEASPREQDADRVLFVLLREHVVRALEDFMQGRIPARDLRDWAEAIELENHVDYEAGGERDIATALFVLANPEVNGPVTVESARKLRGEIRPTP